MFYDVGTVRRSMWCEKCFVDASIANVFDDAMICSKVTIPSDLWTVESYSDQHSNFSPSVEQIEKSHGIVLSIRSTTFGKPCPLDAYGKSHNAFMHSQVSYVHSLANNSR